MLQKKGKQKGTSLLAKVSRTKLPAGSRALLTPKISSLRVLKSFIWALLVLKSNEASAGDWCAGSCLSVDLHNGNMS